MNWRTVIISSRCKLDYQLGYMLIRAEEVQRVFLDEVCLLMIENPAVSLTGCLLEALVEHKVHVVFCNNKRTPISELCPIYGSFDSSKKIKQQISWTEQAKGDVWTAIVAEKIAKQAGLLHETGHFQESALLLDYIDQIEWRDTSNREGHAAKVYFNALFGMSFSRKKECPINAALNYGYGLLLSAFNREIIGSGYLTQLGLFHDNASNSFNFSSDLMEPFRVFYDREVCRMELSEFGSAQKHYLVGLLHQNVMIAGSRQTLLNAIPIYCRSVFKALAKDDPRSIQFFEFSKS